MDNKQITPKEAKTVFTFINTGDMGNTEDGVVTLELWLKVCRNFYDSDYGNFNEFLVATMSGSGEQTNGQ